MEPRSLQAEDPARRAARELRRVLVWLGLLDLAVIVGVLAAALARGSWHLSPAQFLALVGVTVGAIVAARVHLGLRLRPHAAPRG